MHVAILIVVFSAVLTTVIFLVYGIVNVNIQGTCFLLIVWLCELCISLLRHTCQSASVILSSVTHPKL